MKAKKQNCSNCSGSGNSRFEGFDSGCSPPTIPALSSESAPKTEHLKIVRARVIRTRQIRQDDKNETENKRKQLKTNKIKLQNKEN